MTPTPRTLLLALVGTAAACLAAAPALLAAARLPPSPPSAGFDGLVIAHRGGSEHGPENTVAAIERAAADGATAVEVDVFLSADGVPVVIHDPTVDRTTNGTGAVAALTLAELRRLDAAAARDDFADVPIPTLDEVLDAVVRLDLKLEIELKREVVDKDALADAIVARFHERDLYERAWVGSFDPTLLYRVRRREPRIVGGLAIRADATGNPVFDRILLSRWLRRFLGVGVVEPHLAMVDAAAVAAWRAEGLAVNAWTANDGAEQARLRALGVSYTTNCPLSSCADDPSDLMEPTGGGAAP